MPVPYYRLSAFYLLYFGSLGALLPYWGIYLDDVGLTPTQIGVLMALMTGTKIISPNLWAWVADRTGRRMTIVRLGSLFAAMAFAGVLFQTSFFSLAVVMIAFSFFWNATLPQVEATTLSHLARMPHRYSLIRMWGSLGFIAMVLGLGQVFAHYGIALLPYVVVTLLVMIWLASLTVPDGHTQRGTRPDTPIMVLLRNPRVIALLVVCFLMQVAHGPYYTFYSLYLTKAGYGQDHVGQLWALGVISEIGIFLLMHRLVPRFGLRNLLMFALALGVVRWALVGAYVESVWVLIFAQCLHSATFGIFHTAAIQLVHHHFQGRNLGRGQALYSSVSYGAGGAVGALLSGYLWNGLGPQWPFYLASLISLIGVFVIWRGIKAPPMPPPLRSE